MKRTQIFYFSVLIALQLILFNINARDYTPMLDGSPEWYYFNAGPAAKTEYYSYKGDTIINNIDYKTYGICDYYHNDSPCLEIKDFFMREDTTEQQVFLLIPPYPREILLYDFSLEVGDSIQGELFAVDNYGGLTYDTTNLCIVKSVSTMQTLVDERKVIEIIESVSSPLEHAIWIEGIGNIFGLLHSFYEWGNLICFFRDNQKIYRNTDLERGVECFHFPTIVDNFFYQENLTINPNPANNIINISLNLTGSFQCQIINSTGKTVYSSIMQKELMVDVSGFPTGIYFVNVYGEAGGQEGGWTGKVVIGE